MTYYIAKSPVSGHWMREPFRGFSPHQEDAHPYSESDDHLASIIHIAGVNGKKMRLRQVMVATCVHGNRGPCLTCGTN